MNTIPKHIEDFKKRDSLRLYLRNGDLELSDRKSGKWESDNLLVITDLTGTYLLVNADLVYSALESRDLYQYVKVDSTPEYLRAIIPVLLEGKITFSIDANGDLIINTI